MLRASKSQRKIPGMSFQYSVAGTEDVPQTNGEAGEDLKSNRRQSAVGLTAIYKAVKCLCESCNLKLRHCEMRGVNEASDLD